MSCASAVTWRWSWARISSWFGVSGGSGPTKAGPGILTVKSQMTRNSSGRKLAIAIMRMRPQRVRGTMATRIGVTYLPNDLLPESPMAVHRCLLVAFLLFPTMLAAQRTQKPALHGRHWVAITGKPLGAEAGAMIFQKGGNAVDAACAMLAAVTTMWDVLSWGGETQALIYNPRTKKVIAVNALGVAPTGATADFYRSKGMHFPPEYGPLAAITPGTPGGLMVMLAEYGTLSLREVLEPAIRMAAGYPIEEGPANPTDRTRPGPNKWRYSRAVMLPHAGGAREARRQGRSFGSLSSRRRSASW